MEQLAVIPIILSCGIAIWLDVRMHFKNPIVYWVIGALGVLGCFAILLLTEAIILGGK